MPPLQLPPFVPPGVWWYVLWASIHSVIIYLLRVLSDSSGELKEKTEGETDNLLPSLNEHLWRLFDKSNDDPYEGVLGSTNDLMHLRDRIRKASMPMVRYLRMKRHTRLGRIASSVSIGVALVFIGLYLTQKPFIATITTVGIVVFAILTVWASFHLVNVLINNFLIAKVSDED